MNSTYIDPMILALVTIAIILLLIVILLLIKLVKVRRIANERKKQLLLLQDGMEYRTNLTPRHVTTADHLQYQASVPTVNHPAYPDKAV